MTVNRKVTGTASTIPAGLMAGVLTAMAAMLTGTLLSSILIHREVLPWKHCGYAVMVILLASSWLGAMVAAGKIKRRRLLICVMSGMLYFLALLIITGLFFGGQYSGVGETGLLIFCSSMLGVFLKYPENSGRNRRNGRKFWNGHG